MRSHNPLLRAFALGSIVSLGAACHGGREAEQKEQADKVAKQAEIEARAQEIATKVVANVEEQQRAADSVKTVEETRVAEVKFVGAPNDYFESSGLKIATRGDDDHTQRAVREITLTNRSHFAVTHVNAKVDFSQDGQIVASIPLALRGAIPAGATKRFSIDDDTLQSATVMTPSNETKVSITSVTLDNSAAAEPMP